MKKYKNRRTLFNRLYVLNKDVKDMYLNNMEVLTGAEVVLLKSISKKLKLITSGQQRRKENK